MKQCVITYVFIFLESLLYYFFLFVIGNHLYSFSKKKVITNEKVLTKVP